MNIQKIETKNILVVGDVMVDCYITGQIKRISPEAPVPVLNKSAERSVLGGAGNVVSNLVAAKQNVYVATVIGKDSEGEYLKETFLKMNCEVSCIIESQNRVTTKKTRVMAQNNQQLVRIDEEQTNPIDTIEQQLLMDRIKTVIEAIDIVILSDYSKGVLSYEITQELIKLCKDNKVSVFVDVKDKNIEKYKGATLLKPNRNELGYTTGLPTDSIEDIYKASEMLRKNCECQYVLSTLGSKGMMLVGEDFSKMIESGEREVFDVSGAGDTVISYLSIAYANGYDIREAAMIANYAAGIKVTKVGTAPVSLDELKLEIGIEYGYKIVTITQLKKILEAKKNARVVFTNGCFDVLHKGHVSYLKQAACMGDLLVVGLNSDASVKRLKGSKRPVNNEEDRAEVLSALEFVDYVVIFNENTPLSLIEEIKPDVLVKGADYKKEEVIGAKFVEDNGGRVELLSYIEGYSTTNMIKKLGEEK